MDTKKLFNNKTRIAIFRLFFSAVDKEYYLRELERILNIPVSMLRKELLSLTEAGIFCSKKRGNNTFYFLNKHYPLFDELKSIVSKTIGIEGLLKDSLKALRDIETCFIYGSYAKNAENLASDIDLFVIGNPNENNLISIINQCESKLKREINYSLYSKDDFIKKLNEKDAFVETLMNEPKVFLCGGLNGFR